MFMAKPKIRLVREDTITAERHDAIDGTPDVGNPRQRIGTARGGWRQKGRKVQHRKQGDLPGQTVTTREQVVRADHIPTVQAPVWHRTPRERTADANSSTERRAGVRASVVALKPGNAGGAKGRREMNTGVPSERINDWRQCPSGLSPPDSLHPLRSGRTASWGTNVCWTRSIIECAEGRPLPTTGFTV